MAACRQLALTVGELGALWGARPASRCSARASQTVRTKEKKSKGCTSERQLLDLIESTPQHGRAGHAMRQ